MTLLCILAAQTLLCAQPPRLQPRVILPGEGVGSQFWLLAPDIAIVTVSQAERLGPSIEVTPSQNLSVQMVMIDAEVEIVIQGDLATGPLRFYFFTNTLTPDVGYTTPLSWFDPGKRYVVFLRQDGGVLRTMADLTEPNIRIRSGHRVTLPMPPLRPSRNDPATVIASVALTPAADYEKDFASSIEDTFGRLLIITNPGKIAPFLRELLAHPDPAIRQRACLSLATNFSYRDPCLLKLLDSEYPAVKQQANIWMARKRGSEQRLLRTLQQAPTTLSVSGKIEDLAGDLELFTFDWDSGVRQQACDTLHDLFASRRFPNCPAHR